MAGNYYAPFQRPIPQQTNYYNPSYPTGQEMMNFQQAPQYQQQMQQPFAMPNQSASDMIWVLNETEAMSYPVAPNNSVILWDKNNDTVYLKSANMQGVPSMRILDYKERVAENAAKSARSGAEEDVGKFVRVDDFNALQAKFDGLRDELDELKAKAKQKMAKTAKMEAVENE